jgi:hypothetical protein
MDWDIWACFGAKRRLELVALAETDEVSTTSTWILKEMAGENTRKCECCQEQVPALLAYEGSELNPEAYVRTDCNVESFTLELIKAKWNVCAHCIEHNKKLASVEGRCSMIPVENRQEMTINSDLANSWVLFRIEILLNEHERFAGMPTLEYDDILSSIQSAIEKLASKISEAHRKMMPNSVKWIEGMIL